MGNESKKLSQRAREIANDKEEASAGQSGAQAGNPGMQQKQGAKGDGTPNPDDAAATRDKKTDDKSDE